LPSLVELGDTTGSFVVWAVSLERRKDVAIGKSYEAVQKAQTGDAAESFHHPWMQRVVKVEQKASITRESIGEQHPARTQLVLGMVRPRAFLADRCRCDDGSVPIAMLREIDDGKKVAVLTVLVAGPGEEISSGPGLRETGGRRRVPRTTERGDSNEREAQTAAR